MSLGSKKTGMSADSLRATNSEAVEEIKRKERDALQRLEGYRREHGKLEVLFDELRQSIVAVQALPQVYVPKKPKIKVISPCVAVMCINDVHLGAMQAIDEVEGFGFYSPSVCENRCLSYCNKVINWVELHRKNYHLDELRILVLGDLIIGGIHEELKVTNAFPEPVQCTKAGELLARQVSIMAQHFPKVVVEFIVEDNHARLTKKPQAKEAGINSFNYIVGFIAKEMLRVHKNVQFNIYPQYEAVVNVCGRRYLLCHGHGVSGWMGFPYYGIERRVGREAMKRMNGPDVRKFHRVILGHWHAPMSHPWFWISGSVQGTDAYDHKNGRHAEPSQAAWMVHPKHGEFDRTDFTLND